MSIPWEEKEKPMNWFSWVLLSAPKRIEKNPVARIVFPALAKCHQLEARLLSRRALLNAAIAIQFGGRG